MRLARSLSAALAVGVLSACNGSGLATTSGTGQHGTAPRGSGASPAAPAPAATVPLVMNPGDAAALPAPPPGVPFQGHLLISDRGNGRIIEIGPTGAVEWQFPAAGTKPPATFGPPDDAFFANGGATVVANSEQTQTVSDISSAGDNLLWQMGKNNIRSRQTGYFNEPDDAVPQPDGTIWVADIRNCRLVHLSATGQWLGTMGTGSCAHHPPSAFDLPNGAFPADDGSLIVTEIGGSHVTWITPGGTVKWSVHAPVSYPSDAMPLPDGSVLLTDYSARGAVVRVSPSGKTLWAYRPSGRQALNHPSIAIPLAANRIAICDDFGSRIVIVDPTTNSVVWTFSGSGASRLSFPDGLDFLPAQPS